jgi:cell division protein FtsN
MAFYRKVDDHYEISLDHGRMVLAVIGAILLVALVFLIGVLVGKSIWGMPVTKAPKIITEGISEPDERSRERPVYTFYDDVNRGEGAPPRTTTPSQSAKEPLMKTRPTEVTPVEVAPIEVAPAKVAPSEVAAKEKPKAATKEKPSPKKVAVKPAKVKKAAPVKPKPVAKKKVAKKKVARKKVAKKAVAAPMQKSTATAYRIQVSSFSDISRAETEKANLAAQNLRATIVKAESKGKTWYRLYVGSFSSKARATDYLNKVLIPKGLKGYVSTK